MAIAERELTDETTDELEFETESPTSIVAEKAKRERVNLDTLSDTDKITLSFPVPAGLKKALNAKGEAAGMNGNTWARDQLAALVGYDIPDEFNERTRTGKYSGMTEEEIKAAKANEGQKKRAQVATLLKNLKENQELQRMAAEAGVDISVLLGKS